MISGTTKSGFSELHAGGLWLKTASRTPLAPRRATNLPMRGPSLSYRRWHLLARTLGLMPLAMCGLALLSVKAQPGPEPPSQYSEYEVKAAFLYNFAKFVEWPSEAFTDAHAPIILGVYGEDPFGDLLERTLEGKMANGRSFEVKRFKKLRDLGPCHILFVSASERERVAHILKTLDGWSVLSVGETADFVGQGGTVNLTREGNRVRLEINLDSAQRARLKISSRLLTLAKIVRGGRGEGPR